MKVKDLQFARRLLLTEIDLSPEIVRELLEVNIDIRNMGEPDAVTDRASTLIVNKPSSISMFLFRVIYTLLSRKINSPVQRDKMGLGVLHLCRNYAYHDFERREIPGPPVVVDPNKLPDNLHALQLHRYLPNHQ